MPFLNHLFWELLKVIIPINNIGKHAELKNNSFKSSNNKRLTIQTQREREREGERGRETNSIDRNYRISCHCLID